MNKFDQLSWNEFHKHFKNTKIKKVLPFNRMITHTKNFFLIAGYGAFTKGYVIVIAKKLIPSFGHISLVEKKELNDFLKNVKRKIKKNFSCDIAIFEHGMCSCVGGLDRAHLHIMPLPKGTSKEDIKQAINRSLISRKVGIKGILYNKKIFTEIEDIDILYENFLKDDVKKKNIEIIGNILSSEDLEKIKYNFWPNRLEKIGLMQKPYIFFKSAQYSFLTDINIQTQFGREIIYNLKLLKDKNFVQEMKKLKIEKNIYNPWRWQEILFEKNIIDTTNILRLEYANNH